MRTRALSLKLAPRPAACVAGLFNPPKRKLRRMLAAGDYPEALEFGRSIEPKHSGDPDFLFIMGSAHYLLGEADSAMGYFERALAINEFDTDSLLLSARVHAHLGDAGEAARRCRRILEIDAEHAEARELLGSLSGDP